MQVNSHGNGFSIFSIFVALFSLLEVSDARGEAMISIVRYAFCEQVSNLNALGEFADPAELGSGQHLNLWLEIRVNRQGVKHLNALKKLPIYARWGRNGWLTDPPLDIGIPTSVWEEKKDDIMSKIQSDGTFAWRTFTNKAAAIDGRYYVSILDANMKVVTSLDMPTTAFRPGISVIRKVGGRYDR